MKVTVVINGDYGGFSLNEEMAIWLKDNKGWKIAPKDIYPHDEYDLAGDHGYYYPSTKWKKQEFRLNPDLIECVRWLKWKYRNNDYYDRDNDDSLKESLRKCRDLRIVNVEIDICVEDKYDGIEEISVDRSIEEEDNPKSTEELEREIKFIIDRNMNMKNFVETHKNYPELDGLLRKYNVIL